MKVFDNPRGFIHDFALKFAKELEKEDIIYPGAREARDLGRRAREYFQRHGHQDSVHHLIWSPLRASALLIGEKVFRLLPNQLAVVPALVRHEEYSDRPSQNQFVWLLSARDRVTLVAHGSAPWAVQLETPEALNLRVERLIGDLDIQDGFQLSYFKSELCNLLIDAARSLAERAKAAQTSWYNTVCRDMEDFIERHLGESDLSLAQIARHVRLCQSYASSLYSGETGKTLWQYLHEARIRAAKRLLFEPRLNITEVSRKLGFRSLRHFRRTFKKATALTPRQFRQHGTPPSQ